MVREMRFLGMSTDSTLTFTTSPDLATSRGSATKLFDMADTWTRPSWWTPMSTNAPKAATFVTTPSRTMPGSRSPRVCTPSAKVAVWNSGRGSRPGFSSSLRMSLTVGRPNASSVNSAGLRPRSVLALPMRVATSVCVFVQDAADDRVRLGVHARGVERVVAALDPQEARALLERLRAEPRDALELVAGR